MRYLWVPIWIGYLLFMVLAFAYAIGLMGGWDR